MARRYSKSSRKIEWEFASDIKERLFYLIRALELTWLVPSSIYCVRSQNAQSRAIARIWGLGRVWQMTLNLRPAYILEVVSERFDHLTQIEKDKVLLHELVHIPRNFSGALLPHRRRGKGSFHNRLDHMIEKYYSSVED